MSNTYYVLKDKKHGSYVGKNITYVSGVKDARKFTYDTDAKYACQLNDVRAGASLLSGGLNLVRVTENYGTLTYRQLAENDFGKPADRIKYALEEHSVYFHPGADAWLTTLDEGALFDTQSKAINAITKRAVAQNMTYGYIGVNIVRVAVRAGETLYTEEVVN